MKECLEKCLFTFEIDLLVNRFLHVFLFLQVAELEKRLLVEYIQRSPAPSSGSVTPVEGQPSRSHELKKRYYLDIQDSLYWLMFLRAL